MHRFLLPLFVLVITCCTLSVSAAPKKTTLQEGRISIKSIRTPPPSERELRGRLVAVEGKYANLLKQAEKDKRAIQVMMQGQAIINRANNDLTYEVAGLRETIRSLEELNDELAEANDKIQEIADKALTLNEKTVAERDTLQQRCDENDAITAIEAARFQRIQDVPATVRTPWFNELYQLIAHSLVERMALSPHFKNQLKQFSPLPTQKSPPRSRL